MALSQCSSCLVTQKSIMIGTALSHKEQTDVLKKLVKTEVPWNCAHGRVCASLFSNLINFTISFHLLPHI